MSNCSEASDILALSLGDIAEAAQLRGLCWASASLQEAQLHGQGGCVGCQGGGKSLQVLPALLLLGAEG